MFFGKTQNNASKNPINFHGFYRDTVRNLGGYFRNLGINNLEDLEELIQDAYVEAFKSMDKLEKPEAIKAWLYTIARRQYIRYLETKRKSVKTLGSEKKENQRAANLAPQDQTIYTAFVIKLVHKQLEKIEDEKRKDAMRLFFLDLEPLNEISHSMDIKVSTLTTWCNRFRNDLKRRLDVLNSSKLNATNVFIKKLLKKGKVAA